MASSATLHPPNPRQSITPPVAATTNNGNLPLDLLYEILLRLPAEPICRFHAVCRSWRSLLCHWEFIAAAHNPGPLLAIGVHDYSSSNVVHVLDMESGDAVKHVKIAANHAFLPPYGSEAPVTSDDRVMCILDLHSRLRFLDLASGVFSLFPDHAPREGGSFRLGIVGRAACTGEQKVLSISTTYRQHVAPHLCKIITLGKGGWRDTGSPPLRVKWHTGDFAVANGLVYFLSDYTEYKELLAHKIMVFDLNSEAWRPVETSLLGPTERFCSTLAERDGHLVAGHSDTIPSTEIELWFLVDFKTSHWSKRYIITMPRHQDLPAPTCYEYIVKPLAMLDDGRIVMWVRVAGLEFGDDIDVLWSYDPRTKTFIDGTRVPCCHRVCVFKLNLLDSRRRGEIDLAARRLLIARRYHPSGAPSSTRKGL